MGGFATEFHAAPQELIELVGKWMAEYSVVATVELFPPLHTLPITLDNFRQVLERTDARDVIFTEGAVDPSARDHLEIADQYPGALRLQLGRMAATGLEQSSLTTRHTNPMWQKINRELKKLATAGADLVWEDGGTRHDRNARFTAGAKALAASGVPLRQFAQSTYVYLPK